MAFGPNPFEDLIITIVLLFVAIVFSLLVIFKKGKIPGFFVMSVLSNLIAYATILTGSTMFYFYNILWLKHFSLYIWPIINIFFFIGLIIYFFKNKK